MSIPFIISACLSPVLGGLADRFGMRAVGATVAPGMLVLVHLLVGLTKVDPVGPLVGQGIAYALFASVLWPSIPLVVLPKFIGLGYGVVTSVQVSLFTCQIFSHRFHLHMRYFFWKNGGLAAFPLIIAQIYITSGYYIPKVSIASSEFIFQNASISLIHQVEYFFAALAALGFIVGIYLNIFDCTHDSIFNSPAARSVVDVGQEEGSDNDDGHKDKLISSRDVTITFERARTFSGGPRTISTDRPTSRKTSKDIAKAEFRF